MWNLEDGVASFRSPRFAARLDLREPARGLFDLELMTDPEATLITDRLLALDVDGATFHDAYVRGLDLVASFTETPFQPYGIQVYWRMVERPEVPRVLATVEMILSVQTSRLDGEPQVVLSSEFPALGLTMGDNFNFARTVGKSIQLCEMAHPSNLGATNCRSKGDHIVVQRSFFPGRLEKGVICRARVRLAFLHGGDPKLASTLFDRFVAAPPPLTA